MSTFFSGVSLVAPETHFSILFMISLSSIFGSHSLLHCPIPKLIVLKLLPSNVMLRVAPPYQVSVLKPGIVQTNQCLIMSCSR